MWSRLEEYVNDDRSARYRDRDDGQRRSVVAEGRRNKRSERGEERSAARWFPEGSTDDHWHFGREARR